jgi:pre-mRNA-processing factor 40
MQLQEYQPRMEHQERPAYEAPRGTAMPSTDHDYTNPEEAEAVFFKMLRRNGVQPDWTWQQTMKAAIKDPNWRSIKDPKERKIAFDKYVAEVRAQEKDREKDRQAKLRTDFTSMLRSHPEIKYFTRWKTAKAIIAGESIFKTARTEEEARTLFNEYRSELLKRHTESETETRKYALDKLTKLLGDLDIEAYTRWSEAQTALKNNNRFQGDPDFKTLSKIDVLKAFENHIKNLERAFNDNRQKQKATKYRKERENRDEFKELLRDLKRGGKLHARSKWVEIHNLIEDDPRYVAMLGQSGSTPLDLFFDELEVEEDKLRSKRHDAMDVLEVSFLLLQRLD